jgi:hypothetical protein
MAIIIPCEMALDYFMLLLHFDYIQYAQTKASRAKSQGAEGRFLMAPHPIRRLIRHRRTTPTAWKMKLGSQIIRHG